MQTNQLNTYNFNLPKELIAQTAVEPRDHSKLLIYNRTDKSITHDYFYNLHKYLPTNANLVFNNTKVIPARIFGTINQKQCELLLIEQNSNGIYKALVRPGKKFKEGTTISFPEQTTATVISINEDGSRQIKFNPQINLDYLDRNGQLPLPPYIETDYNKTVANRYQTVYAKTGNSIAAPTAGLHFTPELLQKTKDKFKTINVSLDVGLGTFSPIKTDDISEHEMHSENYYVSPESGQQLNQAKANNHPIIAVGTTATRVLEDQLNLDNDFHEGHFSTKIFISPGYQFKTINGLITNFHLPKSSLFILISTLLGVNEAQRIYKEAIEKKYRFYSFGDACLFL